VTARIVENSAPLAYRKELEDLVVEVIALYPHTARWTVAIVGCDGQTAGREKKQRE
jgi:hypothetical protein